MGPFFVDFYCRQAGLIVEVDGHYHDYRRNYDRQRERWLCSSGMRLLRLTNDEVLHHPERTLQPIHQSLQASVLVAQTPSPSGRGGRG